MKKKTAAEKGRARVTARDVGEMMYASLQRFSPEERERRVEAIRKIRVARKNSSKRASTQANRRKSRPPSVAERKHAHR